MAYVTEKRGVFYAVIYEGRNPVSGRERRRWHRCEDHAAAKKLATELTECRTRLRSSGSSLTLGEYLLGQWLPAKEATLAPSTHARYVTSVEHYLLPHLGNTPLRRLQTEHFEALYRRLLLTGSRRGGPLAAKTIANLHQIVRSSLNDAVERGLLTSNPANGAHVPDPRKRPSTRRRARSWTATELGHPIRPRWRQRPQRLRERTGPSHITQKNSRPNHPTTCGKVERFHATTKQWLAQQPPAATIAELQAQLDTFVELYNEHRPHRAHPHRATPATIYRARPKATPDVTADTDLHVRHDRIDKTGSVTLRHDSRLHHIGIGRTHARTHVVLLIANLDIRVIDAATGEPLRHLTLDPTHDYQPTGRPPAPTRKT